MKRTLLRSSLKTCSVISLPVNLGQPFLGPDRAPQLIKDAGLLQLLSKCGWRVQEEPQISFVVSSPPSAEDPKLNARNCHHVGVVCERIYHQVLEQAKTDKFLLILGGDHCIPIGTLPAITQARPSTGIIWVDAHADINTPESSGSGNMHGMPVAFLLNLVKNAKNMPGMGWLKPPYFKPSDLAYIGLRDVDHGERQYIKELGIKAFSMNDVDRLGIGKVMEQCQDHFNKHKNLHLSYDIDALDPFFAPHTGTTVRGGLTFREGNFICEELANSGKLTSMELVEVNPSLHPTMDYKQTIDTAMVILGSTMGERIL